MLRHILITNNTLAKRAGTELYVRDVCLELKRLGYEPTAFTCLPGAISNELESKGIRVVTNLEALETPPDVIHAHHLFETLAVGLRFPQTPMISMCHGVIPWVERPPKLPSIRRYTAVDLACQQRVMKDVGLPPREIPIHHNFVDLDRFKPRSKLPDKPQKALILSNYASESSHVPFVREACRRAGIALTVIGDGAQTTTDRPEQILGEYDLVFAKGRAALEALAVGCAVVLCDVAGCGPMVRSGEIENLRDWNFGFRLLTEPLLPKTIERQIANYDAADAEACRDYIRSHSGLDKAVQGLIALYGEVIAEAEAKPVDSHAIATAAALELGTIRRDMGDQLWRFDPPTPEPPRQKRGRWGRKTRAIWFRFRELLAEFKPRKDV